MHKRVVLHVYSSMYKPSLATGLTGKSLSTPTHLKGPDLNGNCFIAESHPLVINTLANRPVHESDRCHDEAQFQWLRYQLDSRVKLLPTLVAKWIECWKCVNSWMGDRLGIHA